MIEFTLTPEELLLYEEQKRDLVRYIRDGIYYGLDRHEAPTETAERIANTPVMKHLANLDALQEVHSTWPPMVKAEQAYNYREEIRTAKCLQCEGEYVKNNDSHFFCKPRCAKKWVLQNWMGKSREEAINGR